MKQFKSFAAAALILVMALPANVFAASHREAPITALDRTADITDWYAFVSYDKPSTVTMILNVDPLLEPANGPNYFPFDPNIVYQMNVDNNNDGIANDVVFQFQFQTIDNTASISPGLFTSAVGGIAGIPQITSLSGPGAAGQALSQTYTVTMVKGGVSTVLGSGLYAVPSNVGPRTMPNYYNTDPTNPGLFQQGIHTLGKVTVFAGTVDDPFFIDLGGAFDSINWRAVTGGDILKPGIDADDKHNYAADTVGGYNVNTIVLQVPITMLTVDGKVHPSTDKQAVIGTYGSTSRPATTVRSSPNPIAYSGSFQQVQRLGNPLINELIIGNGSKDRFSMDAPENDGQFASFVLDPFLAAAFSALGVPVPPAPRTDLLNLVQYQPPICPGCGPGDAGAIADLLRLNTGIGPTAPTAQKRLGFLYGDSAGFPNGRRPVDDVTDIAARVVAGILVDPVKYGTPLGDGVNVNPEGVRNTFPFEQPANSGRNSHHVGPGQQGCTGLAGGLCPTL